MATKVKTSDILQELSDELDDFVAASVVGADGMSIANLVTDRNFNEERASAALSQLVRQASESSEAMDAGEFEETITTSEKYMFVTRPLGNGKFFIQLVLKGNGNLGAARMYLEEHEESLLDSLPASARR
jgi:predicted regulator of Ras-like GTPase activity (Roadblock/LC7/MglB family)